VGFVVDSLGASMTINLAAEVFNGVSCNEQPAILYWEVRKEILEPSLHNLKIPLIGVVIQLRYEQERSFLVSKVKFVTEESAQTIQSCLSLLFPVPILRVIASLLRTLVEIAAFFKPLG
jgi:hypothetical protein